MTALRWLLLVGALTVAAWVQPASAWGTEDVIRDAAERYGVSPDWLVAVAVCESGLDPYAVGAQGEVGLFQLHPYGLLPSFYATGFTDPWDVSQQAEFTAWMFSLGYAGHWSCAWW